jgi:hypothetical protein
MKRASGQVKQESVSMERQSKRLGRRSECALFELQAFVAE